MDSSRKRPLSSEDNESPVSKYPRLGSTDSSSAPQAPSPAAEPVQAAIPSVESILAVPLEVIFRETLSSLTQQRSKPLLSRAEAQCFLSIRLLAMELDALMASCAQALEQRHRYGQFARRIAKAKQPFLLSLLPVLHTLGETIPAQALQHYQSQLDTTVAALQSLAVTLRQFSEQNWALAESLMDAMPNSTVGTEKRKLSDIQEELIKRIGQTVNGTLVKTSMKEFCEAILKQQSPSDSQQSSHRSQSSRKSAGPKEPTSEEKENAPSQPLVVQEVAPSVNASSPMMMPSPQESPRSHCGLGTTQAAADILSTLASTWTD